MNESLYICTRHPLTIVCNPCSDADYAVLIVGESDALRYERCMHVWPKSQLTRVSLTTHIHLPLQTDRY